MSLVVEDGTGLSNAESYCTVVFATAYHASLGHTAAWAAIVDPEVALRLATNYMEAVWRMKWKGFRKTSTQALSWPRTWVENPDYPGYASYIDSNSVPTIVQQMCADLALRTVTDLLPDLAPEAFLKKAKVGSLEVEYSGSGPPSTVYPAVALRLAPYMINAGSGQTRVARA